MKRLTTLLTVLIVLLATAGVVAADRPTLEPITITGQQSSQETEYYFDGVYPRFVKFHITSENIPGTTRFTMEEWGVADLWIPDGPAGANFGNVKTGTDDDKLLLRFSGNANLASGVSGSFLAFDKTDGYRDLAGVGTYLGNVEDPFTVTFTPCGGGGSPACDPNRCAVFGASLEARYGRAVWQIKNEGTKALTMSSLFVSWPESNGKLLKVKLDGNIVFDSSTAAPPWLQIGADGPGWVGLERDRKIGAGKTGELKFIFENEGDNPSPKDYAVLVNFASGCAVSWAAF